MLNLIYDWKSDFLHALLFVMLQLKQPVSVGFLSFLVDKLIETSCMCSSFPQGLTGHLKKKKSCIHLLKVLTEIFT